MSKTYDYVVVGSGCSGAMAAQTLVEAGKHVTMLDVGDREDVYRTLIPDKSFTDIRKTEQEQYRYLLGDALEGVGWGKVGKGEQITPPRRHIMHSAQIYATTRSDTFFPLESLGYGGLGISWGLQCWEYSPLDLKAAGMDVARMQQAYETVSSRIGISATRDDAAPYTLGSLQTFQDSPVMDANHRLIYQKYTARQKSFNDLGFFLGRTPLALITKDLPGRKKYAYKELDYYSDSDQSAWRPWITVNALKKKPNFTYIANHLVVSFTEKGGVVDISCLETPSNNPVTVRCRKLILATGALGSARIVLRSFPKKGVRLPLLCNPYTYIPCLQPRMLGRTIGDKKLGFAQLSLFFDPQKKQSDFSVASLYGYHALMLFRIIRQIPLNFADGRAIMRYLMSGLEIMGVHHPDSFSDDKFLELTTDHATPTGDVLQATYKLSEQEKTTFAERERQFIKALRQMQTFALKKMDPGYGASVHYGGTLPFSDRDRAYALHPSGRLYGTKHVYVTDSSGFTYLPAQGLTFSLLANAHVTAERILEHE